ncbi:MAG: FkbM family methyltransferase [Terriglobales bacterium]
MTKTARKVLRTLQSEFPSLKEAREGFSRHGRRWLRIPHESDFRALALFPPAIQGCFIDVGANQGQSIESILLFRPDAQIISFEANPGLAQRLAARYGKRRNIRVVAEGLADSAGSFNLSVPSYNGFVYDGLGSFDNATAAAWISEETVFRFKPKKLRIAQVACTANTLDSHGLEPIFIKVDVEGYEYRVLAGGKDTLRRCRPILLVENLRGDARTALLAQELGYEEYYFDGVGLRRGQSRSANAFLVTADRLETLLGRELNQTSS